MLVHPEALRIIGFELRGGIAKVIEAARAFVSETMQDSPPSKTGGFTPSYYSDVCFWWGVLGRNGYPMSREQVLDAPLKILFQCVRETIESKGGHVSNAGSAKRVAEHLAKLNEGLASGRSPKTENRNPKEGRNPKAEIRRAEAN